MVPKRGTTARGQVLGTQGPRLQRSHLGTIAREDRRGAGQGNRGELRTWKLGSGDTAETIQARSFRDVLLATGMRKLKEASPVDRIWGVGFAAKTQRFRNETLSQRDLETVVSHS
ncbi:hypothetical protein GGS21DRAFT_494769 [Xylaria nigripes]|nr:hypothetical protein GGS21DRAFT_494769 [Xylaria nigripes]